MVIRSSKRPAGFELSFGLSRRILFLLLSLIMAVSGQAEAQSLRRAFELRTPEHASVRLFAMGYGGEQYATTHSGFEFDQTITDVIDVVGRASAYQIYKGSGFDSPLQPASRSAVRNFGRFEGGIGITPFQGTTFTMMGGRDVGDSDAPMIESDLSTWIALHSFHPVNFSYAANHFYENGVTNGMIDLRTVALSTGELMLLIGGGGAIWGGGTVGQAKGQGGADLGLFLRRWSLSADLQIGYGSSGVYGELGISRSFGWDE